MVENILSSNIIIKTLFNFVKKVKNAG